MESFKGSKKQFLERRRRLLDINRAIKTLISLMKKKMTQRASRLRDVQYVLLHNKKNVSFCMKNYEDILRLLLTVWTRSTEMDTMLTDLNLDELFKNTLVDKTLCIKDVKQKYRKAVKVLLKCSNNN